MKDVNGHHLSSPKSLEGTIWPIISSEGALIAITPYDYPQRSAARPLFEHTPVLETNLNINAMMPLVTMITKKT